MGNEKCVVLLPFAGSVSFELEEVSRKLVQHTMLQNYVICKEMTASYVTSHWRVTVQIQARPSAGTSITIKCSDPKYAMFTKFR